MLPGVNGASATALKAVALDIATSQACALGICMYILHVYEVCGETLFISSTQGFGKGEFSAWAACPKA